jgi:hypothetical protein
MSLMALLLLGSAASNVLAALIMKHREAHILARTLPGSSHTRSGRERVMTEVVAGDRNHHPHRLPPLIIRLAG